eukprot:m.282502 g.282502  ORF g.282502 m.282502 type:complete len:1292 (+) comp40657_c0_seq3:71-3946(+)
MFHVRLIPGIRGRLPSLLSHPSTSWIAAAALLSLLLPFDAAFTLDEECNFGRALSRVDESANRTDYVGGLFSAHQFVSDPLDGTVTRCSLKQSDVAESFHRFGVEQMEALFFATELLNRNGMLDNVTDVGRVNLGNSVYDTCGDLTSCADNQAKALAVPNNPKEHVFASIIGPYYRESTAYIDSDDLRRLYEDAINGGSSGRDHGVLSLVDEPLNIFNNPTLQSLSLYTVYLQPTCKLQARAAVDFIVKVGWQEVHVVSSGDRCGIANLIAFSQALEDKGLLCHIHPIGYYQGASTVESPATFPGNVPTGNNILGAIDAKTMWRGHLKSPAAVVFLSSMLYASEFFNFYLTPFEVDQSAYDFLVGDFWGTPENVDALYDTLIAVAAKARSFVALRTVTNGLGKFQEHMASIRANSTEIQRNSILKRYWEVTFNCSITNGACDNETALPSVNRPLLRNYKAPLVIDGVFLLVAYMKSILREFPSVRPYFSTNEPFFNNHITNVSSWTGNQVRVGRSAAMGSSFLPVTWSFDILLLTHNNNSSNETLQLGSWTYYGRIEEGNDTLFLNNKTNSSLSPWPLTTDPCPPTTSPPTTLPPTPKTTTAAATKKPPTTEFVDPCLPQDILGAVSVPILVLVLHIVVGLTSLCVFGLLSIRQCILPLPGVFVTVITLLSVIGSILVAVDVFTPLRCGTLRLDFFINFIGVLLFAVAFMEVFAHLIGGIINRLPLKILFAVVFIVIEIIIASLASFRFNPSFDSERDGSDAEHCLRARRHPLTIIAYSFNACLAVGSVVVIWVTYKKGYESCLKDRSIITALLATALGLFYVISVGIMLNGRDCKVQAGFLVVLSAFPGLMTLYIVGVVAWGKWQQQHHPETFPGALEGSHLARDPSHHYVDKQGGLAFGLGAMNYWDEDITIEINTVVIAPERIKKEDRIGKGNFGEVFKGFMDTSKKVAIKSVQDAMNRKEVNDFVREGLQMRDFKHPNVMELYGICWSDDPSHPLHRSPLIVLPYMELGDLKVYLRQCRPGRRATMKPGTQQLPQQLRNVSLVQLVKFAHQIAKGMEYISEKGIVHRDLAARNCMVNWDLEIKVADFGLSRAMKEGKDYYRMGQGGQLPVRWMSPEGLLDFIFTSKSDVWSFGITLWEVMTLAMVPYPGVANQEVVPFLKSGNRLEKPDACPQEVYNLMLQCWATEPDDRPSFSEVICELEEYLMELANYFNPNASDGVEEKKTDPYVNWSLATGYNEAEEARLEKNNAKDETKDHGDEEDINRDEGASEEVEHGKLDVKSGSGSPE